MKTKLLLTLSASLLLMSQATAQVFFQSTMYTYQQFVYNPAVTGLNEFDLKSGATLSLFGRLQWLGIEGAPSTQALSFHTPLANPDAGNIGIMAAVDQLGPLSNTWIQASYAYETTLGAAERLKFRAGIAGGIKQVAININPIYPGGQIDPIIANNAGSTVNVVNVGLHLSNFTDSTNGFFASLAGQNLLEPSIEGLTAAADAGGFESTVPRSFSLAGGYRFRLGENNKMFLQPSVMIQTDFVDLPQASISALWGYNPIVVGLNYRINSGESIGAMLGVSINDSWFLGYAYDYPAGPLNGNFDINTHELVLTYSFGNIWGGNRNNGRDTDILFDGDGF